MHIKKKLLLQLLLLSPLSLTVHRLIGLEQEHFQESIDTLMQEEIVIDQSFKNFITLTLLQSSQISPGLLHCYERVEQGHETVMFDDLAQAMPEFLEQLHSMVKAPRPSLGTPEIAGPGSCDLSAVSEKLNALLINIDDCCDAQNNCCSELLQDFQETWTILDSIVTTLSTFDAGVVIFYNTTTLFVETVVTLTELVTSLSIIVQDLSQVTTLLTDISNTLTTCCATLNNDFQETWTILGAGFNGTFSVINTIASDVAGTFTVLEDIRTILTACCATLNNDFQQTWTILGAGFNGTFSAISTITNNANNTFTVLEDIRTTLTACCAQQNTNFQETWTILNSLRSNGCSNIPITQAEVDAGGGVYVISTSGNYFLSENIVSNGAPLGYIIEITASDVTLDLCNRSLAGLPQNQTSGIFIDTATHVAIKNGIIQDVLLVGIAVNGGSTDLTFDHVTTLSCGIHGFLLGNEGSILPLTNRDPITNSRISSCSVLLCSQLFALRSFAELPEKLKLTKFTLSAFGGFYASNCSNLIIENSLFNNNRCVDVYGMLLLQCSNCTITNCLFNDNLADQFGSGLEMFDSHNNYCSYCTFNNNFGNGITRFTVGAGVGLALTDCTNNTFFNCQAIGNVGESAVGFGSESGANNVFEQCVATSNTGTAAQGYGFSFDAEANASVVSCDSIANLGISESAGFFCLSGTGNSFEYCQALDNSSSGIGAGFILRAELDSSIENCTAKNNVSDGVTGFSFGILLDSFDLTTCNQCYINHNSLSNNNGGFTSFGILDVATNASTSFVASNFAFNNGINFSVSYVSATLPVVSGSFSGALPATGTTGSFDNISIDV